MAMVKLDAPLIEIEGPIGGTIFRYDQCGQHAQAWPRQVKSHEPLKQNSAFSRCSGAWSKHDFTKEEIDQWWRWCYAHPIKNKKAEETYLHPFLAFLKVNIKRVLNGQDIIFSPI